MYFFEYSGNSLDSRRGIFNGNPMTAQIVVAYNSDENCFYSGTSEGDIY